MAEETNENQPIDEIPTASTVAGAKILGVAANGDTNLFPVSAIKGDYKGLALASTNPGTPVLSQYYDAKPGVTYTNFLDAGGQPITIPTSVGADPVVSAKLSFNGSNWMGVFNGTEIELVDYSKVSTVMASVSGPGKINIDQNGGVTTTGQLFIQKVTETSTYVTISSDQSTENLSGTGYSGLNWLCYDLTTSKVRLYNYTTTADLSSSNILLLAYLYDVNIDGLNTISYKNISVKNILKFVEQGDLYFNPGSYIDKVNHKIFLQNGYYQSSGANYRFFPSMLLDYDPGLLLQSIVFDPDLLTSPTSDGFYLTGVGYPISTNRLILVGQIISNNLTTKYSIDDISNLTVGSVKEFYGQRTKSIQGTGNIDIKANGDVQVIGAMYRINDDGNYAAIAEATTPLKAGSNVAGLNWLVFNRTTSKVYLINYSAGGIDRETESVIGYMFDINPQNLKTLSKVSVNGVYPGQNAIVVTGELLLPKKIFMESGRNLPIYKRSVMRDRAENTNELVVFRNGANENDFTSFREHIFGSYLINPFIVQSSGDFISFSSVNNVDGSYDFITNTQIIKKAAVSQTVKGQQIGDSLTNRGASKFIANYLAGFASATITYNTFGTLDNSGKAGEGREGWTFSNFIGRDNYHDFAGEPITRGNTTMNQNPFLKLADATDKANHPDWCFRNTGSQAELSYTSDPDKTGNFYIFDYSWYMAQNSIPNDLQIITIALSTNDFSINGSEAVDRCAFGLAVMLTQIRAALPAVKIGVIPTPVYGSTNDGIGRFAAAADWINKSQTIVDEFTDIDIIGVWAHMSSIFDFPWNDLGYLSPGNNTKKLQKTDYIHFDTQGYLQYAPVVGNWIVNVI